MFTGIITEVGTVSEVQPGKLAVTCSKILRGLELGESISVNGVCLTVIGLTDNSFSVGIMSETMVRSNLEELSFGDRVNLERALTVDGLMGGHLVQGHIDAAGKVASIGWNGTAMVIRFNAPGEVMRYIVEKGFITVDGISLTVIARESDSFQVSVVDYTRRHTILEDIRVGDSVNLEVDIIAKYVEQLGKANRTGITAEFLQENGFLVN